MARPGHCGRPRRQRLASRVVLAVEALVVARTAVKEVGTVTAIEKVGSFLAVHLIVSAQAAEGIRLEISVDDVRVVVPFNGVPVGGALRLLDPHEGVVTLP
jgi:hypothetical protein